MINGLSNNMRVYLACELTDLRKSINSLAMIVTETFSLDPFSNSLFVFCNKNRNKIKILHWEYNGFWIYYKRLERNTFEWPKDNVNNVKSMSLQELRWLLEGIPLEQKSRFKTVKERVIS